MSFKGCKHRLGCTVLLKGVSATQLAAVKKILRVLASQEQEVLSIPPDMSSKRMERSRALAFSSLQCHIKWLPNFFEASLEDDSLSTYALQFVTYCAYRGRVETAFLAAELASAAAADTRVQPTSGAELPSLPEDQEGAACFLHTHLASHI